MNGTAQARMYWLHALSPLHVGAGRGVGFIDLPVMRERVTNWPLVPGSTVKGVLRSHFQYGGVDRGLLEAAFGRADPRQTTAGSLVLSDAHLVALPVRSFYGTFAYCTSRLALLRLARDLEAGGLHSAPPPETTDSQALVAPGTVLAHDGRLYLEDLDFEAREDAAAATWADLLAGQVFGDDAWNALFRERFALVPDATFDFLAETATEVAARVRLEEESKTVADGALWYEESLPAETILAGIAWCDQVYGPNGHSQDALLGAFCEGELSLQVGGKASTGKGLIRCRFGALQ